MISVSASRRPLARGRTRRRLEPGCAARMDTGHVRLLGGRLRLAGREAATQPLRPVHHQPRRARHPLRPHALAPPRGAAAGDHARLAGVDRRVPQGHRAPDQPHRPRRERGRRLPRDLPVAARASASRPSRPTHRLGCRADRGRVGALMARLGYDRYFAQGGDWGSAVTRAIGAQDPDHCAAIHVTLAMGTRPQVDGRADARGAAGAGRCRVLPGTGTRATPSSSPPAPRRSATAWPIRPSGQAGWILEKFWAWTDCDGHPENVLGRDELLDNVMFYWATNSAASSARLYWESFGERHAARPCGAGRRDRVPEGDRATRARAGWSRLPRHRPLGRAAEGRPLRRVRAARAVRRRHPRLLPPVPLTAGQFRQAGRSTTHASSPPIKPSTCRPDSAASIANSPSSTIAAVNRCVHDCSPAV